MSELKNCHLILDVLYAVFTATNNQLFAKISNNQLHVLQMLLFPLQLKFLDDIVGSFKTAHLVLLVINS